MLSSPLHRERDGGFRGFRLSWDEGRSGPLPVAGPPPLAGDWAFLTMLSSPLHRERDGGFRGFRLSWDEGRSGPLPVVGPQPLAGDWAFLPSSPLHQPHSALLAGQRGGGFCCFPETTECGGCVRLSWDQGRSGPLPVAGPQPLGGSWTYFRILLRILSFPLPLPYATLL